MNLHPNNQMKSITVKGILNPTKDGYYIKNHILRFEEIQKYNPDFNEDNFKNKEVEITGKVKRIEIKPKIINGAISQGRSGILEYIVEIKKIIIL